MSFTDSRQRSDRLPAQLHANKLHHLLSWYACENIVKTVTGITLS